MAASIFTRFNTMRMSVIIILLIASVSVASLFLCAFIWSVKNGQFDDDVSPAVRILFDDHPATTQKTNDKPQTDCKCK